MKREEKTIKKSFDLKDTFLNNKALFLLAPLAMVLLFGFPPSAMADQLGPTTQEVFKNGSREVRRRKARQLKQIVTEQTTKLLSSSAEYQQFVNNLTIEQLKKIPQRRFADINGNINISLMLTGDDVSNFFTTILGSKTPSTILPEITEPVKKNLLEKINQYGNKPLTIRSGWYFRMGNNKNFTRSWEKG